MTKLRAKEEYYEQPPARSSQQRKEALDRANEIRGYRAALKKDLKAGRVNILLLLTEPPQYIETMKIVDLLISMPRNGPVKANQILSSCRIAASKTVGGLSKRQNDELLYLLRKKR